MNTNILNQSEALYGFAGWLTARDEVVTASSSRDAGVQAKLVEEFIKCNNLPDVRDANGFDWTKNLTHPIVEFNRHAYSLDTASAFVSGMKSIQFVK